jgi:hypothetical protein
MYGSLKVMCKSRTGVRLGKFFNGAVWHNGTPENGHFGPKHVVLITKIIMNREINNCIIDGKLYKNKLNIVMQQDA